MIYEIGDKLPECTKGKYHRWEYKGNTTRTTMKVTAKGTHAHVALRGVYRCNDCGIKKIGQPQ